MQAESGTACLLLPRLADQKERAMDGARPKAEPAAFRQAEMQGIAAHFEDDGREGRAFDGSLRQPERILQLARRGMEEPLRIQPEILKARSVGAPRLQRADRIADPQQRQLPAGILLLPLQPCRNRHGKSACCSRIAGAGRTELGDRIKQQTAFQRLVERPYAKRQARQNALRPRFTPFRYGFTFRRRKRRRGLSFQTGNGFAERKKPLARQGGLRHGVLSIRFVPVMFLWIPEL